jgi:hypothetical protein
MSEDVGRDIPLPVQRAVRQRCGFGCVICGLPLYEYEHMLGYENVKQQGRDPHVAGEITLLCDQHHRERTSGLLPVVAVMAADKDPFNLREGVSKPYSLHYSGGSMKTVIGGNVFAVNDHGYGTWSCVIVVDGIPMIGYVLADGHILLTVNFFDEYNRRVLRIDNNRLVYSVSPWDIQLVGRNLVIRERSRMIFLDVTFEVPNCLIINRGRLLCNGVEILIKPEHILITNNAALFSGVTVNNLNFGLVIGDLPPGSGAAMLKADIPRYSSVDRAEALRWAKESLEEIERRRAAPVG